MILIEIMKNLVSISLVLTSSLLLACGSSGGAGGDTNKCEMYDPVAGAWTPTPSPAGWTQVGDACSCLLPDGGLIIGALPSDDCTICDPATNSSTPGATMAGRTNEETWILLATTRLPPRRRSSRSAPSGTGCPRTSGSPPAR